MHVTDVTNIQINYSPKIHNLNTGATIFYISQQPIFIDLDNDLRLRGSNRNKYLGYTVSRPKPTRLVFGLTYEDFFDNNQHDEDYFVHDLKNNTITRYYGKSLEKVDEKYKNAHHKYQRHLVNKQ